MTRTCFAAPRAGVGSGFQRCCLYSAFLMKHETEKPSNYLIQIHNSRITLLQNRLQNLPGGEQCRLALGRELVDLIWGHQH